MPGLKVCSRLLIIVLAVAGAACANRPPTLNCLAEPSTVTEGDRVLLESNAVDPDKNARLTFAWSSEAGTLDAQNGSAVFDSTGLAPDNYTVSLEVRDEMPGPPRSWLCYGQHAASCDLQVTVEKHKIPPTVACDPSSASVIEGGSLTLRARASDPNNDALSYRWAVDAQRVSADQESMTFGSMGRSIGAHVATVTVTDVDGLTAHCDFNVTIQRRPNTDPQCRLRLDKTTVYPGGSITAAVEASDNEGDPLSYAWKVDGQDSPGTTASKEVDTSSMAGGAHTVTAIVRDDRGGSCTTSATFKVREKITLQLDRSLDNLAKAKLDEIALRMQQEPRLRALITGHTDDRGSESTNLRVGGRRADAVRDYLVKQHSIDQSRIETQSLGESHPVADNQTREGREQNRRVEIELFVE